MEVDRAPAGHVAALRQNDVEQGVDVVGAVPADRAVCRDTHLAALGDPSGVAEVDEDVGLGRRGAGGVKCVPVNGGVPRGRELGADARGLEGHGVVAGLGHLGVV